jgi:hypothetical protein
MNGSVVRQDEGSGRDLKIVTPEPVFSIDSFEGTWTEVLMDRDGNVVGTRQRRLSTKSTKVRVGLAGIAVVIAVALVAWLHPEYVARIISGLLASG